MPNWVFSHLDVTGSKEEIKRFKEYAKGKNGGSYLDMNNFIPYPRHFKILDELNAVDTKINKKALRDELSLMELEGIDTSKDGYNQGGYEWCRDNWGTKWNFCHVEFENDEEEFLRYGFDTAWSPPEPILIKMSEQFPSLTFLYSYEEESMDFAGEATYKEGKMINFKDRTEELQRRQGEEWERENEI